MVLLLCCCCFAVVAGSVMAPCPILANIFSYLFVPMKGYHMGFYVINVVLLQASHIHPQLTAGLGKAR